MIGQLELLSAQEETLDSDIWRTQDTIMDLRRRLHDARMGTIAATTASQHHEAASTGSSLTPSSEDEKLRADPVKVDTQALDETDTQQTPAEEPEPEAAAVAAFDAAIDLLTEQTVHGAANFALDETTLPLPDAVQVSSTDTSNEKEFSSPRPVLRLKGSPEGLGSGSTRTTDSSAAAEPWHLPLVHALPATSRNARIAWALCKDTGGHAAAARARVLREEHSSICR